MKPHKTLLALAALTLAVVAKAQGYNEPKWIELTKEELALVKGSTDFSFRLFKETRGDINQVISPLSVTYALGMLNNGATGETQQQINEVLGGASCSAETINGFCRKMLDASNTLDEKTKVLISDNIYVNTASGFHLLPDFVQTAADYYDATSESRDFGDGSFCFFQ